MSATDPAHPATDPAHPAADPAHPAAEQAAARAAERAGVEMRTLTDLPDLWAVYDLFARIWRPDPSNPPVTVEQLRAMTYVGNYAAGAYHRGELVGACVGFFGAPAGRSLHSHVAGVALPGRGIGRALKLHQRAWALERGLTRVTWTFDPLVRRNAYFNLVTLAARPREYLVDFYGDIDDAINAGQGSDRLLAVWELTAPAAVAAAAGRPREATTAGAVPALSISADGRPQRRSVEAGTLLVDIPPDIEQLRRRAPAEARAWRQAVREVLGGLLAGGARVTGFSRTGGYVVASEREE